MPPISHSFPPGGLKDHAAPWGQGALPVLLFLKRRFVIKLPLGKVSVCATHGDWR